MRAITVIFTRRKRSPVSWLIRWTVPRSRFALALSSHCIIDAGDSVFEATMLHGVREVDRATALHGQTIVKETRYQVPDAAAGIVWLRQQVCKYQPRKPCWLPARAFPAYSFLAKLLLNNYDWLGALGLGVAPYRKWARDDRWFCYELAAGALLASGRLVFASLSHIGETALMSINP